MGRGRVVLDSIVTPPIPPYALCIGLVADRALKRMSAPTARVALAALAAACVAFLCLPNVGYFIVQGEHDGRVSNHLADVYYLPLTYLQQEQIASIRQHIPPTDKIITDDDIWMALHDVRPYYPYAQSHWNAASDPRLRHDIFHDNSQDDDDI